MKLLTIFTIGVLFGAISWTIGPLLGEAFEPFDSGLTLLLALLGLYVGQVGYFGTYLALMKPVHG